jgi:hypothetical protein
VNASLVKFAAPACFALAVLCACDENPVHPVLRSGPGSPETYLAAAQNKWDKVAGASYAVTFSDWDLDGTTEYACHATKGVIDSCLRTYHPSGDETERSVVREHDTPGKYLANLAKDLGNLHYDSSSVTDTGFVALRKVGVGEDGRPIREGLIAVFDTTYGYPKTVFFAAGPAPWTVSITAFTPD